jgi:hypothetical protein
MQAKSSHVSEFEVKFSNTIKIGYSKESVDTIGILISQGLKVRSGKS